MSQALDNETLPPRAARADRWRIALALALWAIGLWLWLPQIRSWLPLPWPERSFPTPNGPRTYYLVAPSAIHPGERFPLLFFLQGFDGLGSPSIGTGETYLAIADQVEARRFIAVFPRGWPGAFPERPDVRAWYPEGLAANREFLAALARHLIASWPVDPERVILAGFSNGGYFAAIEALTRPDSPFTAFWLDGGAYPYALHPAVPRRRILLSAGERDEHNLPQIEIFRQFILDHGWEEGRNLRTYRHRWAHVFAVWALAEALDFLGAPASAPASLAGP
ncbi:MAG: hypothetical protein OZSIB_2263 [Candidatus Ozemobacter sibiricus]|jgi:predicted esterase|uniref:Uncharacterized protein n=1 Tax=Candidatus Ozemobacter sibiricus TaxID=2268124 RepID=A0A367ZTC7_9BACT|nr:MAG: hypothetical protein OZSIB_2263 [Candidatus Ozemobacter sibiricus]